MHPDRVIAFRNNKTIYRDGQRCIKAFGSGYTRADVFKEAYRQAYAQSIGLSVPAVYGIDEVSGRTAIVTEFIPGHSVKHLLEMQPDNAPALLERLVDLQLATQRAVAVDLPRAEDVVRDVLPLADIPAEQAAILQVLLSRAPSGNSLCHMDFTPGNILIDRSGKAYVVDWGLAVRGDAAFDAAATYIRLCYNYPQLREAYLPLYCEKSGMSRSRIDAVLPLVAGTRMIKRNSGITGREREFLHQFLKGEQPV